MIIGDTSFQFTLTQREHTILVAVLLGLPHRIIIQDNYGRLCAMMAETGPRPVASIIPATQSLSTVASLAIYRIPRPNFYHALWSRSLHLVLT